MIAQYTQAAIVSELKRLANPASVDSIPSSAMQEDHVSMGWSAARKLRSVDGLTRVVAIEVLTAARPGPPGPVDAVAGHRGRRTPPAVVRRRGPGPRPLPVPEIDTAVELVRSGAVLHAVEEVIGELN